MPAQSRGAEGLWREQERDSQEGGRPHSPREAAGQGRGPDGSGEAQSAYRSWGPGRPLFLGTQVWASAENPAPAEPRRRLPQEIPGLRDELLLRKPRHHQVLQLLRRFPPVQRRRGPRLPRPAPRRSSKTVSQEGPQLPPLLRRFPRGRARRKGQMAPAGRKEPLTHLRQFQAPNTRLLCCHSGLGELCGRRPSWVSRSWLKTWTQGRRRVPRAVGALPPALRPLRRSRAGVLPPACREDWPVSSPSAPPSSRLSITSAVISGP